MIHSGVGKQDKMAGLVFNAHASSEENVGSGIRDPLKDLGTLSAAAKLLHTIMYF